MKIPLIILLLSLLGLPKKEFVVEKLDLQYWDSEGVTIVWLTRNDSVFKTIYFEIDSVVTDHPVSGDTVCLGIWVFSKPIECKGVDVQSHPGTIFPRCWKNIEGLSICPDFDTTELYFIPNRWYFSKE